MMFNLLRQRLNSEYFQRFDRSKQTTSISADKSPQDLEGIEERMSQD